MKAYVRRRLCLLFLDPPVAEADDEICEDCKIDELDQGELDKKMFGKKNGQAGQSGQSGQSEQSGKAEQE